MVNKGAIQGENAALIPFSDYYHVIIKIQIQNPKENYQFAIIL